MTKQSIKAVATAVLVALSYSIMTPAIAISEEEQIEAFRAEVNAFQRDSANRWEQAPELDQKIPFPTQNPQGEYATAQGYRSYYSNIIAIQSAQLRRHYISRFIAIYQDAIKRAERLLNYFNRF